MKKKEQKQLRRERDKALAEVATVRRERTLYIRALLERLEPDLKHLPTDPDSVPNHAGVFQVQLHGVDGKTCFAHFIPTGSGFHQELFIPIAITGFTVITPEVVWSGGEAA